MIFNLFRSLLLVTILIQVGIGAPYIRPNETKELFKLEKIPLQVNSMKEIAEQLVIITRRDQDGSTLQQRANAQLITLAMRLDLANQEAREIGKALSQGKSLKISSAEEVIKAKSKLRFYKKWLGSADAGTDANLLAGYLTDATNILDPHTLGHVDSANWSGVLPPLPKRIDPNTIKPKEPAMPIGPDQTSPKDSDDKLPPVENGKAKFHLTDFEIKAPLKTTESQKYRDPNDNEEKYRTITHFEITPINVHFSSHTKGEKLEISVSPLPWLHEESHRIAAVKKLTSPVISVLKARHKTLPVNTATFKIAHGKYDKFNRQTITAPMAIMLESSLLNKPIRDDIHVCAAVNSNGNFIQPINFWSLLDIMRKSGETGRLIIPKECAEAILGLLIHGEADFFTRWEVITVENFDDAINASVKEGSSDFAKASELFGSIQNLTQKSETTKLATNKAVRKRLAEIEHLAPNHLSATALLLQGSGKRPIRLSEKSLAYELLPILRSMHKTLSSGMITSLPKGGELKKIHTQLRADLAVIERIVNKSNDDLYESTLDIANDFRRLATIARRIASSDSADVRALEKSASAVIIGMQRECDATIEQADQIINSGKKNEP